MWRKIIELICGLIGALVGYLIYDHKLMRLFLDALMRHHQRISPGQDIIDIRPLFCAVVMGAGMVASAGLARGFLALCCPRPGRHVLHENTRIAENTASVISAPEKKREPTFNDRYESLLEKLCNMEKRVATLGAGAKSNEKDFSGIEADITKFKALLTKFQDKNNDQVNMPRQAEIRHELENLEKTYSELEKRLEVFISTLIIKEGESKTVSNSPPSPSVVANYATLFQPESQDADSKSSEIKKSRTLSSRPEQVDIVEHSSPIIQDHGEDSNHHNII